MVDYQTFKREYVNYLYSIKPISDDSITNDYDNYVKGIKKIEEITTSILSNKGFNMDEYPLKDVIDDPKNLMLSKVYNDAIFTYLDDVYGNERLDGSGTCLIKNLVGRACQMIHNEDLLGIVKGYIKDRPNLLIIDFGDVDEVNVDIDELIIVGQK